MIRCWVSGLVCLAAMTAIANCSCDGGILHPKTGPGTEYPCGLQGRSCGNGMCCGLYEACGGPGVACPEGYCCPTFGTDRTPKPQTSAAPSASQP